MQSFAPIREYRLYYVRQSHHINQDHIQHNFNQITSSFDHWENIVIQGSYPEITNHINHHHSKHRMHYSITNLAPATNYVALVQARNDYGWNKLSTLFHFSTRAEGKYLT